MIASSVEPQEPFFVSDDGSSNHLVGNPNCQAGWCGALEYPKPCKCGGLVHAEYEDEDYDNVYLRYRCDSCLSTEHPGD